MGDICGREDTPVTTQTLRDMRETERLAMETKEPTPEELAALAAKERAEILDRCAKAGGTKGLTEEGRAKVANEPAFVELCESERRQAKDAMLARNAKRIKELGGKLKAGETLEEYDTRMAKEKKA